MMEDTFLIKILANAQQALDEIKEVNQKLGNTTEQAEKVKKSLTMTDVWASFTMAKGAISAVAGEFASFYNAAYESAVATSRFNTALAQSGITSQNTKNFLTQLATQIQQLTNIEDEQVLEAEKFALGMGVTASEMQKVIEGAVSLSNTFGLSLTDSVKFVTLGLDGQYEALQRSIPSLRLAGTEAEKTAVFNKLLADGFKTAQDQASIGFNKAIIQLGDIKEELGGLLLTWGTMSSNFDFRAAFEFVKMGLAEVVNSFVTAGKLMTAPFVLTGKVAFDVIIGIKNAINELLTGDLVGANRALANMFQEVYKDSSESALKAFNDAKTGATNGLSIFTQAIVATAEKDKKITLDAEQAKADAIKAKQKELADQLALQNSEENKKKLAKAKELNDRLIELEKQFANRKYDIENHADGVKKRADAKELKRMQNYGMDQVDLGEKIAKTKIKGDEQSTESGLKQTQSALSSMQSIFAAQSNQSRAMFNINKGLSLTQATIATYEGATNAYASGAKIDPTGVWPAVYAGIVTAAGLANIATIATQEFEPVEDFISIPGKPLLKARPDDIVIGGTNLLGNGAGNDPLLKAMLLNNKILKEKSMQAILNLGDRLVYMQNLKGQKAVNQGRL